MMMIIPPTFDSRWFTRTGLRRTKDDILLEAGTCSLVFTTLYVEVDMLHASLNEPFSEDDVRAKIQCLFNIEAKGKEFTEILEEQYYPWFAQYVVLKRSMVMFVWKVCLLLKLWTGSCMFLMFFLSLMGKIIKDLKVRSVSKDLKFKSVSKPIC